MITKTEAIDLVDDIFEEQALALGGMVAVDRVEDSFVWQMVKTFDLIRRKILRRLDTEHPDETDDIPQPIQPHPAIEDFLLSLRRS
ncbi:MAG: hypothetical protein KJ970_09950, partial [Candidatus Eisenbacteria bacterium]|nr:hypothetical protein [Candidatus Eisenbacteria bacterium]MBU2691241.1 hypothetical protein [Candidatus Eisenbacteria bacterium]